MIRRSLLVALGSLAGLLAVGHAARHLGRATAPNANAVADQSNLDPRDFPLASDWTYLNTHGALGARARVQTRGTAHEVGLDWFQPKTPGTIRLSQTIQFEFRPTAVATTQPDLLFVAGKSTETGYTVVVGVRLRGPQEVQQLDENGLPITEWIPGDVLSRTIVYRSAADDRDIVEAMLPSLAHRDVLLLKFLSSDDFVELDAVTSDTVILDTVNSNTVNSNTVPSNTRPVASGTKTTAPLVHPGFRHDVHGRGVADHPTLGWLYLFEAHADTLQQIGVLRGQITAGTAPADADEQMAWIPGFALCDSNRDGTIDSYHLAEDLLSQYELSAYLVE